MQTSSNASDLKKREKGTLTGDSITPQDQGSKLITAANAKTLFVQEIN